MNRTVLSGNVVASVKGGWGGGKRSCLATFSNCPTHPVAWSSVNLGVAPPLSSPNDAVEPTSRLKTASLNGERRGVACRRPKLHPKASAGAGERRPYIEISTA